MWGYIVGGLLAAVIVPGAYQAVKQFLYPKITGAIGEAKVDRKLRRFRGPGFSRSRDRLLPAPGMTAQIDNILVSRHGIFVIEMKNFKGIVRGGEKAAQWVQWIPSKNKERRFLNPIRQNERHMEALRLCLKNKYPNIPIYGLVVFGNKCLPPKIPGVFNLRDVNDVIRSTMEGPPVLSCEDVSTIQKMIDDRNITDKNRRRQHISDAKHAGEVAKAREAYDMRTAYDSRRGESVKNQQPVAMHNSIPLDEQIRAAAYRPRNNGVGSRGSYERNGR